MDVTNNITDKTMGNNGAPSLPLLLEPVGKVGSIPETPYGAKSAVVSSTGNGMAGDSTRRSLEVLASAAQIGAASDGEPPLPTSASPPPATSTLPLDATPSRDETKKQRSALLKAAKSLSNDPLVQLSILRAMQQQRVPPDVVAKNKEERDKAAEDRRHRQPKKRKAVVAAPAPTSKKPRVRVEDRVPKRFPDVSSVASPSREATSSQAAPTASAQQTHGCTQNGPALEALLRLLFQPQQAPAPKPSQAAGPNVLSGNLDFVQSLLRAIQWNQAPAPPVQPPVANLPPLQIPAPSDAAANVLDLFRSLGNGVPPYQQVAIAQVLLPFLSNLNSAQNNNNGLGHTSGTSERDSPLSSAQKDSNESKQQAKTGTALGQEVRIPCRARGMPSEHNFQAAHFIIPKHINHGQDLVCSYPECHAGGVKFRYCLFCRIPVAKRNFRLRHSHVDTSSQPPGPDDKKVPSTICVAMDSPRASGLPDVKEGAPRAHKNSQCFQEDDGRQSKKHKRQPSNGHHRHNKESSKKRKQHEAGEHPLGIKHLSAPKKDNKSDSDKKKQRRRSSPPLVAAAPTKHDHGDINFVDAISNQKKRTGAKPDALTDVNEKRLYMWASLLRQRPSQDDEDKMSQWLMNVLAVSDPKAPLKGDITTSPSSLSLEGFH